jgi:hypothetical protein
MSLSNRPPLDDATILITGASSGIGAEMARQLAPRARSLVLVARRTDRLQALAAELAPRSPKLAVRVEGCDLEDLGAAAGLLERLRGDQVAVDVLINNAGFGDLALHEASSWERNQRMIALNVTTLTYLTRHLLPAMIERRRGGILNVSSGFGLAFLPGFAVYVGTKHYVTGFTEALRSETRGTGVAVSQLCPGPVATEFNDVANNKGQVPIPHAIEITAERCARIALRKFEAGRALIIPGVLFRIVMWLNAITPRPLLRLVYGPQGRKLRRVLRPQS